MRHVSKSPSALCHFSDARRRLCWSCLKQVWLIYGLSASFLLNASVVCVLASVLSEAHRVLARTAHESDDLLPGRRIVLVHASLAEQAAVS